MAIARALAPQPRLLLLDEPLGALDLQLRRQMQTELKQLQARLGIAFVYITHDQEEALTMSDRIGILNGGRLEQLGTPEEIYERPDSLFAARFIGQSAVLRGVVASGGPGSYRLRLADGEALSDSPRAFRPGDAVWLCMHCERLRLSAEPREGFSLKGRVLSHRYTGALVRTEFCLKEAGNLTLLGAQALDELPPEGSEAYLSWLPKHAALLPGEASS